jgi:hypothetical protein
MQPGGTIKIIVPFVDETTFPGKHYGCSVRFKNSSSRELAAGSFVKFDIDVKSDLICKPSSHAVAFPEELAATTSAPAGGGADQPLKRAKPSPAETFINTKSAIEEATSLIENILVDLRMAREKAQANQCDGDNSVLPWVFDLGYGVLGPHLGPVAGKLLRCAAELRRHIALSTKQIEPEIPPQKPSMNAELIVAFRSEERRRRTLCAQCAGGENSLMRNAWSVIEVLAGCWVDEESVDNSGSMGMSDPGGDPLPRTDALLVGFLLLLFGDHTQLPSYKSSAFKSAALIGIMPNQSVVLKSLLQQFNESEILKHIQADVERATHPVLTEAFTRLALSTRIPVEKWNFSRKTEFELVRSVLGFRKNPMCVFSEVQKQFDELTKEIRAILHYCTDEKDNVCVWADQREMFAIVLGRWRQHDPDRFKQISENGVVEVEVITWKVDGAQAKNTTARWGKRGVTRIFSQFIGMNVGVYTELSTHSLIRGAITTSGDYGDEFVTLTAQFAESLRAAVETKRSIHLNPDTQTYEIKLEPQAEPIVLPADDFGPE